MLLLDSSPGHNEKSVQILDGPAYSVDYNGRYLFLEDTHILCLWGNWPPLKVGCSFLWLWPDYTVCKA